MNGAAASLPGYADLRARHLQLLSEFDEKTAGSDRFAAVLRFVEEGSAAGVGLDDEDERWSVQGFLDYWTTVLFRLDQIPPDAELKPFDLDLAPDLDETQCPFPGNRAFEESQAPLFFGRDEETAELAQRVASHPIVVLAGDYGTGKTSLIQAGLLPRLRREGWEILPPILSTVPPRVPEEVRGLPADIGSEAPALLVADRMEDVPTRAQAAALLTELRGLQGVHPRLRVLLCIRSSFLGLLEGLIPADDRTNLALLPVGPAHLKTLVTSPATGAGLKLEKRLVQSLVRELTVEPEPLPLLQFVLRRLWQGREGGKNLIRFEDYRALAGQGRPEGPVPRLALVAAAETFVEGIDPADRELLDRMLTLTLRLETGGQPTPRKVAVAALRDLGDPGRVDALIRGLDEAGLVKLAGPLEGHCNLELIHQSLVRHWPRIQALSSGHGAELDLRARLETAARNWDWDAPRARLWRRRATLRESARLRALCPVERAFLGHSVKRAKLLDGAGWLAAAGVLVAGMALVPRLREYTAQFETYQQRAASFDTAFDRSWIYTQEYRPPEVLRAAVREDLWATAKGLDATGCKPLREPGAREYPDTKAAEALCRLLRVAGKATEPAEARFSVRQDLTRTTDLENPEYGWSGVVEDFRFPGADKPLMLSFRGYSGSPLEETRSISLEFFQYRLSTPGGDAPAAQGTNPGSEKKEMASFRITLTRTADRECLTGDFLHPFLAGKDGAPLVIADAILAERDCERR